MPCHNPLAMRILWLLISAASSTLVRHFRRPYGGTNAKESSLVADADDQGEALLCSMDGLQVRLDRNTNVRTLTFGDGSVEARRIQQTSVHCKGASPPSCGSPNNMTLKEPAVVPPEACDLDPQRCPCEFAMKELPPLDREYNFISQHLLSGQVPGLNIDGLNSEVEEGDLSSHSAGASARVLLIGLGGGMLPQYLISKTELTVDAVELNGDVIKVARAFFGIPASESSGQLHVTQGDGLEVVKSKAPATYGAAIVDCFGADRLPLNCRSRDFVDALYWVVRPGGEVLQNTVTGHPGDPQIDKLIKKDLKDLIAAYKAVFGKDAKLAMKPDAGGHNGVIIARKRS